MLVSWVRLSGPPCDLVLRQRNPATERISRTGFATLLLIEGQAQGPPAKGPLPRGAQRRPRAAPAVFVVRVYATLGLLRQTHLHANIVSMQNIARRPTLSSAAFAAALVAVGVFLTVSSYSR